VNTIVIGYGNTLRHDDAIGVLVAERLGGIACHQLTPELAPVAAAADRLVLVDASREGLTVNCRRLDPAGARVGSSLHRMAPEPFVALVELLRGRPQEAYLITAPGCDFSHGEGLSEIARQSLEEALWLAVSLT
jgi:hydrogenase maturation protease